MLPIPLILFTLLAVFCYKIAKMEVMRLNDAPSADRAAAFCHGVDL